MPSKNIAINALPGEINISPIGFHTYAVDFFNAARTLDVSTRFSPVPYYCYSRSIELVLKAFLLAKGVTKSELKQNLCHNLGKAFNKAKELGLDKFATLSLEQEQELYKANAYYNVPTKGFEYFVVNKAVKGYPEFPNLLVLDELVSNLIERLEPICLNAS